MPLRLDLEGQRFGRLLVKGPAEIKVNSRNRAIYSWICLCDCGKEVSVRGDSLRRGQASCGCFHKHANLAGKRFGRLTVLKENGKIEKGPKRPSAYLWLCKCDCGNETTVKGNSLRTGNTASCGCGETENRENLWRERIKIDDPLKTTAHEQWDKYRRAARKRNIAFNLTEEQVHRIIFQNCVYCGVPPSREHKRPSGRFLACVNGIDRMRNDEGYEVGNVVPCCWFCNRAKANESYDDFMLWLRRIVSFTTRPVENFLEEVLA